MLLMMGGFYFWEHRVHVLTIYGSSLINNWNVRRLFDLGASGVGSKVWVLTIGVLEVNPELDSICMQHGQYMSLYLRQSFMLPRQLEERKIMLSWDEKLLALQSVNFKSDDRFVVPGPNGRGSFEAWLAEAPISSHILLFWIGVLGVLSRPWIGTCMARTCMKRTF